MALLLSLAANQAVEQPHTKAGMTPSCYARICYATRGSHLLKKRVRGGD